jgi:hypothetical protein
MIDKTAFEQIFDSFKQKFPPVQTESEASLKLSTTEITEMITDFWPDTEWPKGGLTHFLISQGYKYEPLEVNERVKFLWLIGQRG